MKQSGEKKKGLLVLITIVLLVIVFVVFYVPYNNGTYDKKKLQKVIEQANEAMLNEDYETAKTFFAQAIELNPDDLALYDSLAEAKEKSENAIKEDIASEIETISSVVNFAEVENTEQYEVSVQLPESKDDSSNVSSTSQSSAVVSPEKKEETSKEEIIEIETKPEPVEKPKVWEKKSETFSAKLEKAEGGLKAAASGAVLEIKDNGDVFITVNDIIISDKYSVNKASSGETECLWKIVIDTSLGKFGVVTEHISDGSGEKKITVEDMDSSLIMYVFGKEKKVGDAGITHSSDSITWGFSTTDNISFNKITVKSCNVEIYDTQNMIHYERSYSIN